MGIYSAFRFEMDFLVVSAVIKSPNWREGGRDKVMDKNWVGWDLNSRMKDFPYLIIIVPRWLL